MANNHMVRVDCIGLKHFCCEVFKKLGMSEGQAEDSADILVSADMRGISSHGVARLWRYVNGVRNGVMDPHTESRVVHETSISKVIDAQGSIGLSLSRNVMKDVIQMAKGSGFAAASVRDSNHFGIAGYYAMMGLPEDMIGIAMTNTAALGVPTFGRDAQFGTNPLAIAIPAGTMPPFVLDMATTVVTRGKVENYNREDTPLPPGWAVNTQGECTSDARALLEDMLYQRGGGILPLGGLGEALGGHKGFGLGVLVDILSAVSSGGVFGKSVMDSKETSARVCHFFAAIRIDLFRDPEAFKSDMDSLLREITEARPAKGRERVYYAGLKEHEHTLNSSKDGIPVSEIVWNNLVEIGRDLHISLPVLKS